MINKPKDKRTMLTLTIEPRIKWMIEIMSRKRRCSYVSVMHCSIMKFLQEDEETLGLAEKTWDTNEKERLKKLQKEAPYLLNFNEELNLKRDQENQ
jgi:hypothetical protein